MFGSSFLESFLHQDNAKGIAKGSDDYFVYNTTTHTLYFDSNGNGRGRAVQAGQFQ